MDINTIDSNIKKEASSVLFRVLLFILYYISLILIGIGLFVAAFGVTWLIIQGLSEISSINGRLVIIGFIMWLAMWWFCIQIAWYLIKPLFSFHSSSDDNRVEVKKDDCPKLFSMIEEVAKSTGNKMPKHVYLSAEVNACVFYNSTSIWSIFFPTRKNLMVGLGLLKDMNHDELKAILSHEFGHFSQQTMKVGSITYRLLLIIHDMIDMAREQQESAALSRGSDDGWAKFFHLASGPISFITGKTIAFYNYIEKKNRSLSRYMEFEADAVACRVVSAEAMISALYKLDTISNRYGLYENVIASLLTEKHYLKDYWSGYDTVENMLAKDEELSITCTDILTSPVGDGSNYPSKVTIVEGWNTHPTLAERIESASQFKTGKVSIDTEDARDLISNEAKESVGLMRQKFIAANMQEPQFWNNIKEMNLQEFKPWVEKQFEDRRVPNYLFPFTNKNVVSFSIPSKEEMLDAVPSPFTDANREMLLEFGQGVADWQTLNQFKNDGANAGHLFYEGKEYSDCNKAIELQKAYLDPFNERLLNLDVQIYKYLWQRAKNKTNLNIMYWAMFFGNDAMNGMKEIVDMVNAIKEQANFYQSNGQSFSLRNDIQSKLTSDFWNFMRGFDYKNVSQICGDWKHGDKETVNDLLNKWYGFASQERPPYISTSDLFDMVDDVYPLVQHLYNLGKSQWNQRVMNAYYDIEENEEPEPVEDNEQVTYEDIWDSSLENVSDGEKIRYVICDHISKLGHGESISPEDIFGKDNVSIDQYMEFLKVTTQLTGKLGYETKEEMEKAISGQDTDPDTFAMKQIAYSYAAGTVVEQNLEESTKWFMKAADENDAEALDRVGGAYLHGAGIKQDISMAALYYKKSIIADGFADALLDLGLAYLKGEGVPQNTEHGFSLMIRSAKQGNAAAQYNMGYLYRNGLGTEKNMQEALRWYHLSADQEYDQAVDFLKNYKE